LEGASESCACNVGDATHGFGAGDASHDGDDECDFDGDDSVSEEEAEDCADAIEDALDADVTVVCADDDDGDGWFDEDGDDDGEDDDGDGWVDEDDDCDSDDLVYVIEDVGSWWV